MIAYAALGLVLAFFFSRLSPEVETRAPTTIIPTTLGLHRSRGIVFRLSSLFTIDAFASGLLLQSFVAYWFHIRFGVDPAVLGTIFFWGNLIAGLSALLAARLAARFGLINSMIFTHVPANALLILVPLMPTLPLAVAVLLARFSMALMDMPIRQSYMMAVVSPDERSAASGVAMIARSIGSSVSPVLTGIMFGASLLNLPFFLAGGLRITYDLALYVNFRALKPPEES